VSKWATFVIALIVSKVVLVVIFLLATAQVSAPIDADLQSVSEPIAGVVLMLVAGFAPYMSYKAISFMGFDMYHAMSAEQEAKSALNRPVPIPTSRRPGHEPSKVLNGGTSGGSPWGGNGATPTPAPTAGSGAGPTAGGPTGAASTEAGIGAGAGGSAAGGVAAGVAVGKEAAVAGARTGHSVGAVASQQADAANQVPPTSGPPVPPHVADSLPARSNGTRV
jgi:hypothetical protein